MNNNISDNTKDNSNIAIVAILLISLVLLSFAGGYRVGFVAGETAQTQIMVGYQTHSKKVIADLQQRIYDLER